MFSLLTSALSLPKRRRVDSAPTTKTALVPAPIVDGKLDSNSFASVSSGRNVEVAATSYPSFRDKTNHGGGQQQDLALQNHIGRKSALNLTREVLCCSVGFGRRG